jgi:hypothetical protein
MIPWENMERPLGRDVKEVSLEETASVLRAGKVSRRGRLRKRS